MKLTNKIINFFDWNLPISRKEFFAVGIVVAIPLMIVLPLLIGKQDKSLEELRVLFAVVALVVSPIPWTMAVRRAKTVGMRQYWLWFLLIVWLGGLFGLRFLPFTFLEVVTELRLIFFMPNKVSFGQAKHD